MRGFTLIELLITLVLISILTVGAVAAYDSQIRRTNRSMVKVLLADLQAKQERFRTQNRVYATNFDPLIGTTGSRTSYWVDSKGAIRTSSANPSIYRINLTALAAGTSDPTNSQGAINRYQVTATAVNRQTKDNDCRTLGLTFENQKSATNSGNSDSTSSCW